MIKTSLLLVRFVEHQINIYFAIYINTVASYTFVILYFEYVSVRKIPPRGKTKTTSRT
jgi:hypothetical protein